MSKNNLINFRLLRVILMLLFTVNTYVFSQQPAFPGAEGFGRFATGGRGGTVYHVTSLNDDGPGSFRDAVSQPNRIVVFDVSGIINIATRIVVSPDITIAGQTAPGDGVAIYGNGLSFSGAGNTICRYLRVRMGINGEEGKDAITISNGSTMIFDHVSVSWGKDENFSINWDSKGVEPENITIQNSIIAQGLETHSCGGLIQTSGGVSLIRNLYIDNDTRNPKVKGVNQFVNNVVYNWGVAAYILGDSEGDSYANVTGNYFINGPSVSSAAFTRGNLNFHLYAAENYQDDNKNGNLDGRLLGQSDYDVADWVATPYDYPVVDPLTATGAYNLAIESAGASLPARDEVDARLIYELTSLGTAGELISNENVEPMNGPGLIKGGKTEADSDGDGMPDRWEYYYGMNPYDNSDQNGDMDSDGYTNVEEYLNQTDPGKGSGILSDRTYFIVARHSQKALDIKDKSIADGTPVVQNTQQKVTRQIWNVTNVDENYYSIINDSSNLCMDLKDQSVSDSALIILSPYVGDYSQQWRIEFLGEGCYSIINRQSGKSPEVEAASTDDGIPLIQRYFVDSTNQQFMLVPSELYYSKPSVFITAPFSGTFYTLGSSIKIEAEAEDFDGSISKVEFYQSGIKAGTDSVMPFTCEINGATAGTYQISAIAVDDDNLVSAASNVTFTVVNGGSSPCTIQENETGFCSLEGTVDNNHGGFTGSGFANTDNAPGKGINWKANIPASGTYTLTWRYAHESGNRTGRLLVNNQELISVINMPATGSWTAWTVTSISAGLPEGESEIRLEATNENGLGNIDFFEISGAQTAPVFCGTTDIKAIDDMNRQYKVYPNPFIDKLIIESHEKNITGKRLQLFNSLGEVVISEIMLYDLVNLNVKNLPSGIYYLILTDEHQSTAIKLVKE